MLWQLGKVTALRKLRQDPWILSGRTATVKESRNVWRIMASHGGFGCYQSIRVEVSEFMGASVESSNPFAWTSFYMEFADKLLQFKNDRPRLLGMLRDVHDKSGLKYPFMEDGQPMDGICPFTVFGCFNKGLTEEKRSALARNIGRTFGVKAEAPVQFDGVPVLTNLNAWFFSGKTRRKEDDIPNLWALFEAAIAYADNASEATRATFVDCYDKVRAQLGIRWNLTMGLYWIRPYSYINLDERNRNFLTRNDSPYWPSIAKVSDLRHPPTAETYLRLNANVKEILATSGNPHHSFPELSRAAWVETNPNEPASEQDSAPPGLSITNGDSPNPRRTPGKRRYWIYSAAPGSSRWDEFYRDGLMALGRGEMGDLRNYDSKDAMKTRMKELYGSEYSYMNAALAIWQFAYEMRPDDVVYVKRGVRKVIGRGIVKSDYIFDANRREFKHIRKVEWTHKGEWEHPGQAVTKALTDITPYTDYVRKLESLFKDDESPDDEELAVTYEPYTEKDFLDEVFMDADRYKTLVALLRAKRNVILQGAPGVGKTFAAKRLAFSMMGQQDTSRVMMVQFHQSYSYEDFIMGFRPSKEGFELVPGPFYQFCKAAKDDNERDYFFIIDEINRGNVSKIFGEMLMLIEKDKRGEELRLLYSDETFLVPSNVYIIGLMNTADRSLAIIDYALRRRFAFFELEPAFDSEGFRSIRSRANNPKFDALVEQVKALNEFISKDESLGSGFRIGHSYLCANGMVTEEWLRGVVMYELLPLLREYWFDEPSKIDQWAKRLYGALDD